MHLVSLGRNDWLMLETPWDPGEEDVGCFSWEALKGVMPWRGGWSEAREDDSRQKNCLVVDLRLFQLMQLSSCCTRRETSFTLYRASKQDTKLLQITIRAMIIVDAMKFCVCQCCESVAFKRSVYLALLVPGTRL